MEAIVKAAIHSGLIVIVSVALCIPAYAELSAVNHTPVRITVDGSTWPDPTYGVPVTQTTAQAGEDVANDVMKVETRVSTIPAGGTTAKVTADQLYKSGSGWVQYITCHSDATATAGTIAVLDNTSAGAGNVLYQFDVLAVAYNTPFWIPINTSYSVGLYLDFTTTADVSCTLGYR